MENFVTNLNTIEVDGRSIGLVEFIKNKEWLSAYREKQNIRVVFNKTVSDDSFGDVVPSSEEDSCIESNFIAAFQDEVSDHFGAKDTWIKNGASYSDSFIDFADALYSALKRDFEEDTKAVKDIIKPTISSVSSVESTAEAVKSSACIARLSVERRLLLIGDLVIEGVTSFSALMVKDVKFWEENEFHPVSVNDIVISLQLSTDKDVLLRTSLQEVLRTIYGLEEFEFDESKEEKSLLKAKRRIVHNIFESLRSKNDCRFKSIKAELEKVGLYIFKRRALGSGRRNIYFEEIFTKDLIFLYRVVLIEKVRHFFSKRLNKPEIRCNLDKGYMVGGNADVVSLSSAFEYLSLNDDLSFLGKMKTLRSNVEILEPDDKDSLLKFLDELIEDAEKGEEKAIEVKKKRSIKRAAQGLNNTGLGFLCDKMETLGDYRVDILVLALAQIEQQKGELEGKIKKKESIIALWNKQQEGGEGEGGITLQRKGLAASQKKKYIEALDDCIKRINIYKGLMTTS